ncbi:unnamed protein product [Ectocarpus sp. CCAP 1310/34]|nr:unnamed protein product [Ectocarpus sp. CCAP 1310/34]
MAPVGTRCLGCALFAAALSGVSAFVVPTASQLQEVRALGRRHHDGRSHQPTQQQQRRTGRWSAAGVVMMGRRAAKIAKVKGREDAKRGKAFARIGKKIIMAVKAGGPNEDTNKQLADTIKEAKHNSVPKDNIARAIKRAVDGSQGDFKEVIYEAYGHGGTGMVVTALTDNVNRAIADVKAVWKKQGLKQAAQGSVLFQFEKRGRVEVQGEVDEEQVIEAAIESGVDDVEVVEGDHEGTSWILTSPKDLMTLTGALSEAGITGETGLALIPSGLADVDDEAMELNLAAVEALLELEDVDTVDHNMA